MAEQRLAVLLAHLQPLQQDAAAIARPGIQPEPRWASVSAGRPIVIVGGVVLDVQVRRCAGCIVQTRLLLDVTCTTDVASMHSLRRGL